MTRAFIPKLVQMLCSGLGLILRQEGEESGSRSPWGIRTQVRARGTATWHMRDG